METYGDDGGAKRHYVYGSRGSDLAGEGKEPEGEGRELNHFLGCMYRCRYGCGCVFGFCGSGYSNT